MSYSSPFVASFSRPCRLALFLTLLTALLAFAAASVLGAAPERDRDGITPLDQREGYRYTPVGPTSEPYGQGPYGPEHLRRMSPTEALPAPPRVEHVLPVGPDGKVELPNQ